MDTRRLPLLGVSFRSRVARRILALFIVSALVPVVGFAFFSWQQVSTQLERDARTQLREESKGAGMATLERLLLLQTALDGLDGVEDPEALLAGRFRRVFVADRGTSELGQLDESELKHLLAGNTLLRTVGTSGGTASVLLIRQAPGREAWLVAEVDPVYLWPAEISRAARPFAALDSEGRILFASHGGLAEGVAAQEDIWEVEGERYFGEHWELFLMSLFRAPSWTVAQGQLEAEVLLPLRRFRAVFPLVSALALAVVVLLSLTQIRRSLVPIEKLRAATARVAERDFDVRVAIETNDEFRDLGDAFNGMAERVGDLTRNLERKVEARTRELAVALDDLRAAQAQLVHREKMAGVGQLVAGIAHEMNNPLSFVEGNLHFLRTYLQTILGVLGGYERELGKDGDLPEPFGSIRQQADLETILEDLESVFDGCADGVQRATHLVKDLRTFSRPDDFERVRADLVDGIESTLNLLRPQLEEVEIVRQLEPLPLVECLAGQVNQVFMNLLSNAADAVGPGGRIMVRTECLGDNRVAIVVEDDGPGVPPEIRDKIFDPFFTTKDVGQGTGLGLSISFGVIERHGGSLRVEDAEGGGARFTVELPVAASGELSSVQTDTPMG